MPYYTGYDGGYDFSRGAGFKDRYLPLGYTPAGLLKHDEPTSKSKEFEKETTKKLKELEDNISQLKITQHPHEWEQESIIGTGEETASEYLKRDQRERQEKEEKEGKAEFKFGGGKPYQGDLKPAREFVMLQKSKIKPIERGEAQEKEPRPKGRPRMMMEVLEIPGEAKRRGRPPKSLHDQAIAEPKN